LEKRWINMQIEKNGPGWDVNLKHGESLQVLVPASEGQTSVHLEVSSSGKLCITGGASIIEEISGEGMAEKIRDN